MKPSEVIAKLTADGWTLLNQKGSHRHFVHPTKPGKVTVAMHNRDIKKGTLNSICKQAGWK